ncbi:hypothetical protein JVT61DRAFT_5124 [Boletus reticuloceps]|uniref:Uncharacterized protein n=1 Tax=Boletus reticuloceps TaxID=495285 RepID=A0A8I2YY87_9AGAM|nr:hypothetical protein JVT61DRAFT_5124 [Boletus reticuloceps]
MRFTFVSLALLALAHSLAPGVHGAPAVDSDRINPLAVRQDISGLVGLLSSLVESLLGSASLSPADVTKVVEALQSAAGLVPRALPSSSGAASPHSSPSSTISSSSTTTTTTSAGLATGTASNVPSVSLSTPHAPSATLSRMRRQLATPLPVSVPSVPSIPTPGAQSSHSSMQSVSASVPSSKSATSTSTRSNTTPSASRV